MILVIVKWFVSILTGLFLWGGLLGQELPDVCINEFLASNVSIDADIVDFDDYSDWIELYNGEDFELDLGGYYITDDLENPLKWEIPSETIIQAKGFIRFWADGYDEAPGSTYWRSWLGPNAELCPNKALCLRPFFSVSFIGGKDFIYSRSSNL